MELALIWKNENAQGQHRRCRRCRPRYWYSSSSSWMSVWMLVLTVRMWTCSNMQHQPQNGMEGGFLGVSIVNAQSSTSPSVCTVDELFADDCAFAADGACDAGTLLCEAAQSDCFDCDPCQIYATSTDNCEACLAAGCAWCIIPSQAAAVCSSLTIANAIPNVCVDSDSSSGGTPYQFTSCDSSDSSVPPSTTISNSTAPAPTTTTTTADGVCSIETDVCPTQWNGKCEAGNGLCPAGTSDCFDCNPCMQYRYQGCDACVANADCLWCEADAICVSADAEFYPGLLTCTAFASTCNIGDDDGDPTLYTSLFADPFVPSQAWLYTLLRIAPVWAAGFTGAGIGIRINDDGLDDTHPEFTTTANNNNYLKFNASASCSIYTPSSLTAQHNHGTTCASLAAASGNNSVCAVGIAPDATLSACRVVPDSNRNSTATGDVAPEARDFSFLYRNMESMHISSNSYGIDGCRPAVTQRRQEGEEEGTNTDARSLQSSTSSECPFVSDWRSSPCLATQCAGTGWSTLAETASTTNSTCESYVITYCQVHFEDDVSACTAFLDWGVQCEYNGQSPLQLNATMMGIAQGRGGKGIIYVYAAGNSYSAGSDVNFEGALNSRYTISVGAVGKDGLHASYSIGGAPLFVSAPGGDLDSYTNNIVALAGGGCTDGGAGTSFAAPVVSGLIALILQANPELFWRDVQGILALTSRQVEANDTASWTINAAGFHHSYLYGFGLVDANASVTTAQNWVNFPPEIQLLAESGAVDLKIPDFSTTGSTPATSTVTVNASSTFVTESVIVYLDLTHSSRGDVEVVLTSPSGTASILAPGQRPENSQTLERWKLMTVRNWGEPADGVWTLSLIDQSQGDLDVCVDLPDWSKAIGETQFDCAIMETLQVCQGGVEGPGFSIFSGVTTGIDDVFFTDENGIAMTDACCVCGGGAVASTVSDVLRSWRIAVYGHNSATPSATLSPGATAPIPTLPLLTTSPMAPSIIEVAPSILQQPQIYTPTLIAPVIQQGPAVLSPQAGTQPIRTDPREPSSSSSKILLMNWVLYAIVLLFISSYR